MTGRRVGWALGIARPAALLAVVTLGGIVGCGGSATPDGPKAVSTQSATAAPEAATSAAGGFREALVARIRTGDDKALTAVAGQLVMDDTSRHAAAAEVEAETADLVALAAALRDGYSHFNATARSQNVEALRLILDRLAREGVGRSWSGVLQPAHEIMTAALTDSHVQARVSALDQLRKLWSWAPGCSMTPAEEQTVGGWKQTCYDQASRRLSDPEPVARASAAGCIGSLPIDDLARPAVACLRDPELGVRYQALVALASRPNVLGEEAILPLLHDSVPDLAKLAEKILAGRGLDADLIAVSRMVTAPKPEMRASAIPVLMKRPDIDPVVWLLRLTEDTDAAVRLKAVEALAGHVTPEVRQRLRELVAADDSPAVRAAAEKIAPIDKTAALPPLPGSASLNPRAN
jgi:hypothetical protein